MKNNNQIIKKKVKKLIITNKKEKKENKKISDKVSSKIELNSNSSKILIYNPKISKINYKEKFNQYNDAEINSLSYQEALKSDIRTYLEYYISLLKRKQILIFTFYTKNDYNSRYIKICLFTFSMALDYTVNALFYIDNTMHKIYVDKGEYNFLYQLPQILYSTLISSVIDSLLEYLALTEDTFIEIKKNSNKMDKIINIKKCLKIKLILFFILKFLFLLLFWYYISCFCMVYKNTQIHLIKDTLISFVISLLYPFVHCLLPGIFRIPSLRAPKQDKKCLYGLSQFLENVSFLLLNDC